MYKDRSAKCAHWESLSNTSAVLAGCHILGPCHAASDAASRWGVTPLQVGPLFVINPCAGNMGTCHHHHWPLGRGQVGVLNFDIDTCLAAKQGFEYLCIFDLQFTFSQLWMNWHLQCKNMNLLLGAATTPLSSECCASLLPKISPTPAASERPQGYQGLLNISSLRNHPVPPYSLCGNILRSQLQY